MARRKRGRPPGAKKDVVRVGQQGRIVLPRELRARMGVVAGDSLSVTQTDDGFLFKPVRDVKAALAAIQKRWKATGATVEEFLAERRREAARERGEQD